MKLIKQLRWILGATLILLVAISICLQISLENYVETQQEMCPELSERFSFTPVIFAYSSMYFYGRLKENRLLIPYLYSGCKKGIRSQHGLKDLYLVDCFISDEKRDSLLRNTIIYP